MAFKPAVAPIKAGVYPLLNKPEFQPFTEQIVRLLTEAGALEGRGALVCILDLGDRIDRSCIIGPTENNRPRPLPPLIHPPHTPIHTHTTGISNRADTTGVSVGRRYSRADEIGCPFGITIDFDTLRDRDVTLRDRDTTVRACGWVRSWVRLCVS